MPRSYWDNSFSKLCVPSGCIWESASLGSSARAGCPEGVFVQSLPLKNMFLMLNKIPMVLNHVAVSLDLRKGFVYIFTILHIKID